MSNDAGRLNNLKRAIDTIEHRINQQAAGSGSQESDNSELALIQQQLNRLAGQVGNAGHGSGPGSGHGTGNASIPANGNASGSGSFERTLAPAIETGRAAAQFHAQQKKLTDALLQQLGSLKKDIAGLKKDVSRPITVQKNLPDEEVKRIAAALSNIQGNNAGDAARISRELDDLRSGLTGHINELFNGVDALSVQAANAVTPRVEGLASQLDAMRATIDDLPQTLAISRLEERIGEISEQLQKLPESEPVVVSEPDLSSLESRMDEIARALVAVSNMGGKNQELDLSALDRLDERLNGLNETVAHLADARLSALENEEVQALSRRIEGLTERLGSFEKYAEAGDMGGASALFAAPDTGVIEDQLKQLTQRVEQAVSGNSTAAQISGLEAQIGQILRQMNKQPAPSVDFSPVEERLGHIEQQLANQQQFAIDAAHQAAQQAIAMVGPQSESGQMISSISDDLRNLQQVAESGVNQSSESIGSVQSMLNQIVDRLGAIEGTIGSNGERIAQNVHETPTQMPRAADLHVSASAEAMEQAMYQGGGEAVDTHTMAPPPLDPADAFANDARMAAMENHAPLEPGADAPDLDQMVQQASSALHQEQASLGSGEGSLHSAVPEDIHTDPVGAARRALQATTAEMSASRDETKGAGRKSMVTSRFSPAGIRKPLIVVAAASLLFVLAAFGYKTFMTGDEKVVAKAPAIEQSVDEIANDPAPKATSETEGVAQDETAGDEQQSATLDSAASQLAEPSDQTAPGQEETVEDTAPEAPAARSRDNDTAETVTLETPDPLPQNQNIFEVADNVGPAPLVSAAREGDPRALFEVAMRYSAGKTVKRDMVAAATWFERAADSGYAPAQYSIGSLYEKGIGVEKDAARAADWYGKSAAQGNARAMHNLAVIHAMGAAGEPDMNRAVQHFTAAANYGIKDSQFNLGILHGQGMGVPQNLTESYKWFAIAARSGDADAAAKRDEVGKSLSSAELATAKDMVAQWRVKTPEPTVNRVSIPDAWKSDTSTSANSGGQSYVRQAQVLLNERGFDVGTPDGLMGPRTAAAIREFQRSAGIAETGTVDKALMEALASQS